MKQIMTTTGFVVLGIGVATVLGIGTALWEGSSTDESSTTFAKRQSCEELTSQVKAQLAEVTEENKKNEVQKRLHDAEIAQGTGNTNDCIASATKAMQTLGISSDLSPKKGS